MRIMQVPISGLPPKYSGAPAPVRAALLAALTILLLSACENPVAADKQMDAETGNEKAVPVAVAKVQKMASREKIELPGTILPWAVTTLAAELARTAAGLGNGPAIKLVTNWLAGPTPTIRSLRRRPEGRSDE